MSEDPKTAPVPPATADAAPAAPVSEGSTVPAVRPAQADMALLSQLGDLAGTLERPADADPNDLAGTEGIEAKDIRLPRLAIAQGLSPQMLPNEPTYIKGLTIGDMFNDVTGQIYGPGPMIVVPIIRRVVRIEFDPNDKKVPLDMNVPAGDKRLEWTASTPGGKKDTPPRATEFFEFVSLLIQKDRAPETILVSIKATNKDMRKAAKDWTTFIAMRNAAIYRGLYALQTKFISGTNKKGESVNYGVLTVRNAGWIPTDKPAGLALLEYARQKYEQLKDKNIDAQKGREGGVDDPDTFDVDAIERSTPGAPAPDPGM